MTHSTNEETHSLNGAAAPEIVAKAGAAKSPVDGRELLRADAGNVQATAVTMDRAGAETVVADRVSMERSGTRTIETKSAQLDNSGVMFLKSDSAAVYKSSIAAVSANELRLSKSNALIASSRKSIVEGDFSTVFHIGPVSGDIRVLIDGKRILMLGAVIAAIFRLLGMATRRSGRHESEG
jgi:hypothetical protein